MPARPISNLTSLHAHDTRMVDERDYRPAILVAILVLCLDVGVVGHFLVRLYRELVERTARRNSCDFKAMQEADRCKAYTHALCDVKRAFAAALNELVRTLASPQP